MCLHINISTLVRTLWHAGVTFSFGIICVTTVNTNLCMHKAKETRLLVSRESLTSNENSMCVLQKHVGGDAKQSSFIGLIVCVNV